MQLPVSRDTSVPTGRVTHISKAPMDEGKGHKVHKRAPDPELVTANNSRRNNRNNL